MVFKNTCLNETLEKDAKNYISKQERELSSVIGHTVLFLRAIGMKFILAIDYQSHRMELKMASSKCVTCNGSGKITCVACNGLGEQAVFDGIGKKAVTCPSCRGEGKRTCPTCSGTGKSR